MARRNPGEILFTTAGPKVNRKRKNTGITVGARVGDYTVVKKTADGVIVARDAKRGDAPEHYRVEATTLAGLRKALGVSASARSNPKKRANGAASLTEMAAAEGAHACRTKHYGYNVDDAAAQALAYAGPLGGADRRAWEAAFVRGWRAEAAKSAKKRTNGAATSADPVAARELELYIENEAALVGPGNTIGQAVMRNLAGKILRGTYDRSKAWKAWSHLVDEGARRYTREFGEGKGYGAFNAATRRMVAVNLSEVFEREIEAGGLSASELAGVKTNGRRR